MQLESLEKKGKKKMIVAFPFIIVFFLIAFFKMKYGTYAMGDFNRFFRQTKQEILEENGELVKRESLHGSLL